MHDQVGPLQTVLDEGDGLLKVAAEVEALVVFAGDVESVGNDVLGVCDFVSLTRGEDCFDSMF